MRCTALAVVLLLMAALVACHPTPPPQPATCATVTMTVSTGAPTDGIPIPIRLRAHVEAESFQGDTDDLGVFTACLAAGTYTPVVTAAGYVAQVVTVVVPPSLSPVAAAVTLTAQ